MGRIKEIVSKAIGLVLGILLYGFVIMFALGFLVNLWKDREEIKDDLFILFFVAATALVARLLYAWIRGK